MTGIGRSRWFGGSWRTGRNDGGRELAAPTIALIGVSPAVGEMTR